MDNKTNRLISLAYQLYDTTDGEQSLLEQTADGQPFTFISGMGIALDAFEAKVEGLTTGDNFDFTLTPDEAYGDYDDNRILDLDKEMFEIDGRFDAEHVRTGAIVPLQNEEGARFNAIVAEVTADKVKVDLNHPLAGRTLCFKGSILEAHEATNAEIQAFVESLQSDGCGHCEGHCGGEDGGEGHCCHGGEGHGEGHCCHEGEGHGHGKGGCKHGHGGGHGKSHCCHGHHNN